MNKVKYFLNNLTSISWRLMAGKAATLPIMLALYGLLALLGTANAQNSLNVTNYGARGDCAQVWVGTVSNSVVVTFTNSLSTADIGKAIELFDVGKQQIGIDSHNILSTNYQGLIALITNVIGSSAFISGDIPQVTSNHVYCVYGTDNSSGFQAAVDAARGTNTIIQIPAGSFLLIPPCQYTNFVPAPDSITYWIQGFIIRKGGLDFRGAGRDSTILMSAGAWKRQEGWWHYSWDNPANLHYTTTCVRGQVFNIIAPITNDYPIVFEDLTFDGGMAVGHTGSSGNMYANVYDGRGWDGTSGAGYDSGSGLLPTLKTFTNCKFQHMMGEMIKGLTSTVGKAQTIITNCIFTDGNATAFNMNTAHIITGCTFSDMYQVEEFYLAHSQTYPSYFVNNYVTNISHNIISLNGGTLTNLPYVISNNVFYCDMNGNALATCPAANVIIVTNLFVQSSGYTIAICIGQAGAQAGAPDACNTNYLISGNTFRNKFYTYIACSGAGATDQGRAENVRVFGNRIISTNGGLMLSVGWTKNFQIYSNDFTGVPVGQDITFGSGGAGSQYAFVGTNNNYWKRIFVNGNGGTYTNNVDYAYGSRYLLTYPFATNANICLVTNQSQIPIGAQLLFTNGAWTRCAIPIYFDNSRTRHIMITNGQMVAFSWNGLAWTNDWAVRLKSPSDLHIE